jgi:methylthioribose-1-phosphate isomerase
MMLRSLDYSDGRVRIIDQTLLPRELHWVELDTLEAFFRAIADMQVRGAPLIGIAAAFGLAVEAGKNVDIDHLAKAAGQLLATRPTAVNLQWSLTRMRRVLEATSEADRAAAAWREAAAIAEEDVANCRAIGENALPLLESLASQTGGVPLQVMTHCNAGWLATLEWGTALAPIYLAHQRGIPLHVWVSETRPRNQGADLTAWELAQAGIDHTVITDSAAGYLMREGRVDCCIVGSDRTAANGDVCNKIGTYLKAVAARANTVPFYVALPLSTVDWSCVSGAEIPIEERSVDELGIAEGSRGFNPAFDVTPAVLVDALITEKGVHQASREDLSALRPPE